MNNSSTLFTVESTDPWWRCFFTEDGLVYTNTRPAQREPGLWGRWMWDCQHSSIAFMPDGVDHWTLDEGSEFTEAYLASLAKKVLD